MTQHTIPSHRIKRGERYFSGRYWSAFMAGSVLAHVLTFTAMSDAALSFMHNLRRPQPATYPLLYVGLVYPRPAPLKAPLPTPLKAAPGVKRMAKSQDKPGPLRPAMEKALPETQDKGPAPHAEEDVKPTPALKEPVPDAISVIRGSEETKIAIASLPFSPEKDIIQDEKQTEPAPGAPEKAETAAVMAYNDLSLMEGPGPQAQDIKRGPIFDPWTTTATEVAPPFVQADKDMALPALKNFSITGHEAPAVRAAAVILPQAMVEPALPLIKITQPGDSDTSEGAVEVKGIVTGEGVNSVFLTTGKRVMELLPRDGSFSATVALEQGENVITASASDSGGREAKDRVRVNYTPFTKDLSVRVTYSGDGGSRRLKCGWRAHPLAGTGAAHASSPEFKVSEDAGGARVSVGAVPPGIYTIGVEYDAGEDGTAVAVFDVTLYGHDPSRNIARTVGPVRLHGKGYTPAVRVLLPECVFWEDDGWFSGKVEGNEGVMKYKEPEGIVWREEE